LERIKTGIEELTSLQVDFPEGKQYSSLATQVQVKTIFGLQFALTSCQQNLKTVYITTEEDSKDLFIQGENLDGISNLPQIMACYVSLNCWC
jgi:KaiC/GvpD/RAD55 family RecA-like ATPase